MQKFSASTGIASADLNNPAGFHVSGRTTPVIALLSSRTLFFALFQCLLALFLWLGGSLSPWQTSAAYWPFAATFGNLLSIGLLSILLRREGSSLGELYHFDRAHIRMDLITILIAMIVMGPVAMLPMMWLGNGLFGNYELASEMMFRPLPVWAAYLSLLFPATIAFAELPTYFGFIKPRLEKILHNRWLALLVAAIFLSVQHITLPLIFDWRFIVWRSLMFLPFALAVGLILNWRPRLLPYFMIGHALIDLSTVIMIISISV